MNSLTCSLFSIWKIREMFLVVCYSQTLLSTSCWRGQSCCFRFLLEPTSQHQMASANDGTLVIPCPCVESWEMAAYSFFFLDSVLISSGFFPLPLLDPDTEVCLHVLRLLQSVILEPEVLAKSACEMRDTLPFQRIITLSKSRNAELQALAKELLEDLKILEYEA